ncbi:helix-turn-helix domain-containing protein [Rhizobium gallicum]|uniref:helix-turn-helix domain-containing protein n=1 Tax=Rhizobium gallicum TaxID=56730 RepID=UPI0009FB3E0B|nr:helix-turn-helix domain-containing protein [Rhizobium gallicum]
MIHRAFRSKLAPTGEQEVLLRQFAGVVRLVYNLALESAGTGGGITGGRPGTA